MAQFTKVNGDLLPVLRLDATSYTNAGANAVTSAATVQPQGPKLDFFTISASSTDALSGTQVSVIIQTVQELATVYIYEYTDGSPDTLAMAVYPTGAWAINDTLGADANIIAQVRAALTAASVGNVVTATATATFTG